MECSSGPSGWRKHSFNIDAKVFQSIHCRAATKYYQANGSPSYLLLKDVAILKSYKETTEL